MQLKKTRRNSRPIEHWLKLSLANTAAIAMLFAALACSEKPDILKKGSFSGEVVFRFGNDVRFKAVGNRVTYAWSGYNMFHGNFEKIPWERLSLCTSKHRHAITDKDAGNGVLIVDGVPFKHVGDPDVIKLTVGSPPATVEPANASPELRMSDSSTYSDHSGDGCDPR